LTGVHHNWPHSRSQWNPKLSLSSFYQEKKKKKKKRKTKNQRIKERDFHNPIKFISTTCSCRAVFFFSSIPISTTF
jgi:hypothetical protein